MSSLAAALYVAVGVTCSPVHDGTHCTVSEIGDTPLPAAECRAFVRHAKGYPEYDCIPDGEPAPGPYFLTVWTHNGKRVRSIGQFPTYDACIERLDGSERVSGVWTDPAFRFAEEIWCVRDGE